jgi:hypothetical protein
MVLRCSRCSKCCSCCKTKGDLEAADCSRRRSNATSRMSKKQSRSSSTAVEVSVHTFDVLCRTGNYMYLQP